MLLETQTSFGLRMKEQKSDRELGTMVYVLLESPQRDNAPILQAERHTGIHRSFAAA
jgi:hypothetical protein